MNIVGGRTASEVHEARTAALKKKHDLGVLTNAHMLYEQFIAKYYISEYKNGVEASTRKSKEGALLELKEVFGKKKPEILRHYIF